VYRRLAILGDAHVGSQVGLWPDYYETRSGNPIPFSKHQKVLKQYLDDFFTREARDAEMILFGGDLAQGSNVKGWGSGTTTPVPQHQAQAAIQLFMPYMKGRPVFGVSGSDYHQALTVSLDQMIIEGLGGVFLGAVANLKISGTNKVLNWAHGHGPPYQYPGTFLDKESMFLDMAIGKGDLKHPVDLFCRHHYHQWDHLEKTHRHLIVCPGWQLWFEWAPLVKFYGHKKLSSKVGAVIVDISSDNIIIKKCLYDAPVAFDNIQEI
jgi:hypothetical protein